MHTSDPPVVHLDMKPENILQLSLSVLTHSACILWLCTQVEDNTLHTFLADFGLGRLLNHTRIYGTATIFAGTPGFQAPEKLRGESVTTGVDIYGILLELFTGVYTSLQGHGPTHDHVQSLC